MNQKAMERRAGIRLALQYLFGVIVLTLYGGQV
jgi:hypothetical protein